MKHEIKVLVAIGAGVLVFGLGLVLWSQQNKALNQSKSVDGSKLMRTDSQFFGKEDAPNVLVEFADYQCPACAGYKPVVDQFMSGPGKDKVKLVFRNFPLSQHKNAYPAAQASIAASKQGKFAQMHDKLFEEQKSWSTLPDPKGKLFEYAKEMGLDMVKFEKDYNDTYTKERIKMDYKDGETLGVNSTPTFFLNGEKIQGINFTNFGDKLKEKLK